MGALPPNPCQRDIVPLESHFSTHDSIVRAEREFSALFVDVHREAQRKFWSSFFKSLRSPEAEPLVAVRRQRNSLFVQQIRMGGLGEPYQGVPPYFFDRLRGNPSLGFPLFDCSAIKFTLSCVWEGEGYFALCGARPKALPLETASF